MAYGRRGVRQNGRGRRDGGNGPARGRDMALSGFEVGRWLDRRDPRPNARMVASELCVAGFRRVCPCRSPTRAAIPPLRNQLDVGWRRITPAAARPAGGFSPP